SGSGNDTVNVRATSAGRTLVVEGQAGADKVNIGVGNTQGILSPVIVHNFSGRTALTVDDSVETTARTVTLPTSGSTGPNRGLFVAPAIVTYVQDDLSSFTINGANTGSGAAGNTFNVLDTFSSSAPSPLMTLNTGNGVDTVNVQRTTVPLTVNGQNSKDIVNV